MYKHPTSTRWITKSKQYFLNYSGCVLYSIAIAAKGIFTCNTLLRTYLNAMKKIICIGFMLLCVSMASAYSPRIGDFYFQDLNCGELCNAITNVTSGYENTEISHVAMLVQSGEHPLVIEAIGKDVHLTSLQLFLARSKNSPGKPMVMVGRLKAKYRNLIPLAVKYSKQWIGLPYNESFKPNNLFTSFYCSQLIYDAFMLANNKIPIFHTHRMTYKINGKTLSVWRKYFNQIGTPITEGKMGTNPGMMSRSEKIKIIYQYGKLRKIPSHSNLFNKES